MVGWSSPPFFVWKATAIPFQPGMNAFHPRPMMAMATNGAMPMMGGNAGEECLGIEVSEICEGLIHDL